MDKIKDYDIIAFDAQYFLYRNMCALKSRTGSVVATNSINGCTVPGDNLYVITTYDFTVHDLVKHFFYTVVKLIRDSFSCNKIILLWDYPPYHKTTLLPDFKGSRTHHCQELLDEWDVDNDPEGYLQESEEYRIHNIFIEAKYWIQTYLADCGMPSVSIKGFEADDLAYVFTKYMYDENQATNAICSADNDWLYWIHPNSEFISFNKSENWTYQDALDECEGVAQKLGMSLFEIKQWMDSTFYSHNDLQKTTNLGWNQFPKLVEEVRSGDYHNITDRDRLEKNLKSFEIWNYPNYQEAINSIKNIIENYSAQDTFTLLRNKGFKVSDGYFHTYLSLLT